MSAPTFLFIWSILAGTQIGWQGPGHPFKTEWRAAWMNSGQFESPDACYKAAANLGLSKTEFRCISKTTGEVK